MLSTWVLSGVVFTVVDRPDEEDNPLELLNAFVVDESGDVDALLLFGELLAGELPLDVVRVNPFVVDLDGNLLDDLNCNA